MNDPSLSREARDRAAQQRKEMGDSEKHLLAQWFQSCEDLEHLEPLAKFLSARLQRDGGEKLFPRLSRIVERYFNASYSTRDTWDRRRPWLCLLTVEWLRDDTALWKFVEAVLVRWANDVGDPHSVHRRSTVLHQTARDHCHEWKRLATHMVKINAISPGVAGADHYLSQISSDECAKALRVAKRAPRDRRDQLALWRTSKAHFA
jgi:hypothetical protein